MEVTLPLAVMMVARMNAALVTTAAIARSTVVTTMALRMPAQKVAMEISVSDS